MYMYIYMYIYTYKKNKIQVLRGMAWTVFAIACFFFMATLSEVFQGYSLAGTARGGGGGGIGDGCGGEQKY